jgi:L-amino acid N-acyltransferase YncA
MAELHQKCEQQVMFDPRCFTLCLKQFTVADEILVPENISIRSFLPQDWPAAKTIYEGGIATGNATFQTQSPDWTTWDSGHLAHSRLVAVTTGGRIAGWAALSPVSARFHYWGVAEVSVYIDADFRGKRIGGLLLAALIQESEQNGIWTLQASIFPENSASLRLHQRYGFRQVGYRERIAQLHGVWRNTVWQERRSQVVGTNS